METAKRVFKRFFRGAVAGSVSAMATLIPLAIKEDGVYSMTDVKTMSILLGFSGIVGFVTGGILSLDKYLRMEK